LSAVAQPPDAGADYAEARFVRMLRRMAGGTPPAALNV